MIDTHTHLYLPEFDADGREQAVDRAVEAGVEMMIFPNVNVGTIAAMKSLHAARPELTRMAMGLHPTELEGDWRRSLQTVLDELEKGGYVGVGEIGMDLYWDRSQEREQREVFIAQLEAAKRLGLPVIIHCREALPQTLECIREAGAGEERLLFHCFTAGQEEVRAIRKACPGAMFGIGGVVTYKSARSLRDCLAEIGLDHIVLETDSPYLTPVPHRGKRNESAYLPYVCRQIAATLGVDEIAVEAATDANARQLFLT